MLTSRGTRIGLAGALVVLSLFCAGPTAAQAPPQVPPGGGEYDPPGEDPNGPPGEDPYGPPEQEPDPPSVGRPGPSGEGSAPRPDEDRSDDATTPSSRGDGGAECANGNGNHQGSATPLEDGGNVASVVLARTGLDLWLVPLLGGASIGAGAVIAVQRRSRPSS